TFVLKTPPAVQLLKRAAGVDKGSAKPNREKAGRISRQQVRQIVEVKSKDLNAYEVDAAMKMIESTTRSMGLEVIEQCPKSAARSTSKPRRSSRRRRRAT